MYSRMTSPAYLTALADRLLGMHLTTGLKRLGLAPAQFLVLVDLAGGQSRTQKELVRRLAVEQPTMANTLARMERDGLIIRTRSAGDRRQSIITATAKAEAIYGEAVRAAQSVNELATRGLTTEERLRFVGTLARIIENLQAEG
jgi:DNA-binding MarR family transcriptional regulator